MPASPDLLRFDPVTPIHKAVRHLMFEVLGGVGALDATDIFEVDRCRRQVLQLLGLLPSEAADRLDPLLADLLRQREAADRSAAAASLYRGLSHLVAEQLAAQLRTEAERTPLLQAEHTDLELRVIRRQQLAAMSESELAGALRPMADALTPQELAAFLDDLQMSVDRQTFGCLLDSLRRQSRPGRWLRLARELGLADTGTVPDRRPTPPDAPGDTGRTGVAGRRPHRADRHRHRAQ